MMSTAAPAPAEEDTLNRTTTVQNNDEKSSLVTRKVRKRSSMMEESDTSPFLTEWGFTLRELYNLALQFYKEKQGKAVHFSYEERMKFSALNCQITHGKFNPDTAPSVGVLDVIGKDRRLAWQALGDKSRSDCMFEFITLINSLCPLFKPFVEAHKRDLEEKNRVQRETDVFNEIQTEEYLIAQELEKQAEENRQKMEVQKRKIQDALNRQTFDQFLAYAEQQYPGNPEQQAILIRQLQEQHYEQYMRQLYQQQLYNCQQAEVAERSINEENGGNDSHGVDDSQMENKMNNGNVEEAMEAQLLTEGVKSVSLNNSRDHTDDMVEKSADGDSEEESQNTNVLNNSLAAASMWTRKDIKEFKDSVRAEGGEAVIRIGQGESVTVRVPTHAEGSCLFWEFATDYYDIGFGLFFEWTDLDEPVSVQVTEDTSEDDDEEDEALQALQEDLEKGKDKDRDLLPKGAKPNTGVIIPVFRRDAHQEVYVGSHLFPGKGVYLLKFDNSYSFWRSKTLYYRVFYTK